MIARDAGDVPTALQAAREMSAIRPSDPQIRGLLESLEEAQQAASGSAAPR